MRGKIIPHRSATNNLCTQGNTPTHGTQKSPVPPSHMHFHSVQSYTAQMKSIAYKSMFNKEDLT